MRSALLAAALAFPLSAQDEKKTHEAAIAFAREQALEWSKEAYLLRATCKTSYLLGVEPSGSVWPDMEFLFATKENCPPGQIQTRVWTLGSGEPAFRTSEPKPQGSATAGLPAAGLAPIKAVAAALRKADVAFDPFLELAVVHGKPLWYTLNSGQLHHAADGLSGKYLLVTQGNVATYVRDTNIAVTSWKQLVDALDRELKGWKAAGAQLASLTARGKARQHLDAELGLTEWELTLHVDKPAPATILFRVSNGGVSYWVQDRTPADRSHFQPLSSWSLAGAGTKIREHAVVKEFLSTMPNVAVDLTLDAARLKTGEALFRITDVQKGKTLEVALDKRGAAKSAKKP